MDMVNEVRQQLLRYRMLENADTLICALSGGADSVCLAHILWRLSTEWKLRFACAHFNHRLRGEESERDEAFVQAWCREREIPLYLSGGDVIACAEQRHLSIEEAARELRYAFFDSLGDEKTRVATAHHTDDAAETLLLNLLRGSGMKGLCGIPPVRGRYIRPLLTVSHEEILAYLKTEGLDHVEDSTNETDDCRRNILRHRVLPVLRELNPAFSKACVRTGELLRQDETYLEQQAKAFLRKEEDKTVLSVKTLRSLPEAVSSRAVRLAAEEYGVSLRKAHIDAVTELCRLGPSASANLPEGLVAYREYDRLCIGRHEELTPWQETTLPYDRWVQPEGLPFALYAGSIRELEKVHGKFTSWFFKKENTCGMIHVRPRRGGDTMCLPGRDGRKTLKKWMIEMRIPAKNRDFLPVLADDAGVLAVPGVGVDVRIAAAEKEADAVIIILERT